MKALSKFFTLILVVLAVFVLLRDGIVKTAVEIGTRTATGLPLKIEKLHIGLLSSTFSISGLTLENPDGFQDRTMVSLPELFVDYSVKSFFAGAPRVHSVRVHLAEFNVVRNSDGKLNLDTFKSLSKPKQSEAAPTQPKPQAKTISIGKLALRIDKVSYKDYTVNPVRVQDFNVGINEEFSELPNLVTILKLIATRAFGSSIASLANLNLGDLQSSVSGIASQSLGSAADLVKDAKSLAEEKVGETAGKVQETATKALDSVQDMAGNSVKNLAGKIKMPFGGGSSDQSDTEAQTSGATAN